MVDIQTEPRAGSCGIFCQKIQNPRCTDALPAVNPVV